VSTISRAAVTALSLVLGSLIGFRFGAASQDTIVIEKPEDIVWNGVTLTAPRGTHLLSWPEFSGYYLLDVTASLGTDTTNQEISAQTSEGRLYVITDATYPIASWADVGGEQFFQYHVESSAIEPNGEAQAVVYCGQAGGTQSKALRYRLYVAAHGHGDALGFVGGVTHVPTFIAFATSALQKINVNDFVDSSVGDCIVKLSS
jgi:hypothetical protein